MANKEKGTALFTFFIFLLVVAGGAASFALPKLYNEEVSPDPTTRFYVVNESEIVAGKSTFYRVFIENREGTRVNYGLRVRLGGETIYSQEIRLNHSDSFNETVSFVAARTDNYQKLEFLLLRDNETYRTRLFQISPGISSHLEKDTITNVRNGQNITEAGNETYLKQRRGDISSYTFDTGEQLELKVSDGYVSKGNAIYSSAIKGKNIIFLGGVYEKAVPTKLDVLYPVLMDVRDKNLKFDEVLSLKNGYTFTFKQINNRNLKLSVYRNNKIVREIFGENSSFEYWKEIDEYKKQKIIQVIPKRMSQDEILLDVIQYSDPVTVFVGNKYGEFEVTDVANSSIIMKNIEPIKIEDGKEISLINGKIKIKL